MAVVGVILVALLFWAFGRSLIQCYRSGNPVPALLWLAGIGYLGGWYGWYLPWRARRSFREQKAAGSEFSVETSPEGITFASSYGSGTIPWDHILRWREGGRVFLLYISSTLFQVIPKRLFAGAEQEAEFRDLLRERVGPPK